MRYEHVTFMLCLPRSRSKWLTEYLNPISLTMHDPLKACASIEELRERVDARMKYLPSLPIFVADTAAIFFIDQVCEQFPGCRFLFVGRNPLDVHASVMKAGGNAEGLREAVDAYADALAYVVDRPNRTLYVRFEDVDKEALAIWNYVGGVFARDRPPKPGYTEEMISRNIQLEPSVQRRLVNIGKVTRLFATRTRGVCNGT